jgi:hypothetical protein
MISSILLPFLLTLSRLLGHEPAGSLFVPGGYFLHVPLSLPLDGNHPMGADGVTADIGLLLETNRVRGLLGLAYTTEVQDAFLLGSPRPMAPVT